MARLVVRWNRPVTGFGAFVVVNNATDDEDAITAARRDGCIEPGATSVSVDPKPRGEDEVFVCANEIDARDVARGAA